MDKYKNIGVQNCIIQNKKERKFEKYRVNDQTSVEKQIKKDLAKNLQELIKWNIIKNL